MTETEQHRVELLEAEIRKYRQALRILADAVLAGRRDIVPLALRAKLVLDDVDE